MRVFGRTRRNVITTSSSQGELFLGLTMLANAITTPAMNSMSPNSEKAQREIVSAIKARIRNKIDRKAN